MRFFSLFTFAFLLLNACDHKYDQDKHIQKQEFNSDKHLNNKVYEDDLRNGILSHRNEIEGLQH